MAPALSHPHQRKLLLTAAQDLRGEQHRRIEAGERALGPAQVVTRLVAFRTAKAPAQAGPREFRDDNGKLLLKMTREPRGGVAFLVPSARTQNLRDIVAAVEKCLTDLQTDR
jgi:hypothetical protein